MISFDQKSRLELLTKSYGKKRKSEKLANEKWVHPEMNIWYFRSAFLPNSIDWAAAAAAAALTFVLLDVFGLPRILAWIWLELLWTSWLPVAVVDCCKLFELSWDCWTRLRLSLDCWLLLPSGSMLLLVCWARRFFFA